MKTKKRIKIGIATTFVIVILMSLCGSRFVFQKACVRRETSWLNMGTADDYIYNLLVDAYNIRKEKNETVTIKASDGINLVGHYYERDKNAPLIIFFHGLWSNGYVSGEPTYKITKNQGWNLLLVSMRAHDESEGEFSTFVRRAERKQQDVTEHEKCLTNGTYERARESGTEQNYNMIDGCVNNNPKKPRVIGNRVSVLDRLHIKLENRKQKEQGQQQQQERTLKN